MMVTLEDWKTFAEACEAAATVIALVLGGAWTYLLFVHRRERYPRAKTSHKVSVLCKVGRRQIIRITVKIENLGGVLISLSRGEARIQQLRPLLPEWERSISEGKSIARTPEQEFQWPTIDRFPLDWSDGFYIVEPGESEEFNFDLCLDDAVASVQVYSYFKDASQQGREIGWNSTTTHRIEGKEEL